MRQIIFVLDEETMIRIRTRPSHKAVTIPTDPHILSCSNLRTSGVIFVKLSMANVKVDSRASL